MAVKSEEFGNSLRVEDFECSIWRQSKRKSIWVDVELQCPLVPQIYHVLDRGGDSSESAPSAIG